jgi:hypothetical protein
MAIEKRFAKLQEKGIISLIGSKKDGHYKVNNPS